MKEIGRAILKIKIRRRHSWYRRQYVDRLEKCVADGGSYLTKTAKIHTFVESMVQQSLNRHRAFHEQDFRRWGLSEAERVAARSFFSASGT